MIPLYQNLPKWFPKFSLAPGKSRRSAPNLALGLVCVLLANCTPLPQTLPQTLTTPPEITQQTDTEEETGIEEADITEEDETIAKAEPTVISHGLEEEETIIVVDDDDTGGEWETGLPGMREKSGRQILLAKTQLGLGDPVAAVETLLKLDSAVTGKARLETRKTLLQILESLDSLHRSLLLEDISDPDLVGWLALLEALAAEQFEVELQNWRLAWPNHPASATLIDSYTVNRPQTRRKIALLLPLASPDGRAAQAFYDGFTEAHNRDGSYPKPELALYDIGADSSLASFYYQGAEADGADFIVGPLGRKTVASLLASRNPATDTLLLADIPPAKTADNLYGLSLSPENEARQVADKAYASGHRNATVLRSEGEWGERVANAFAAHWETLGGQVLKNSSFPKDVSNHARVVRKFLGIDRSILRHRLIEAQTGLNLKFSPRRNEDMDFIFLAATTTQARLIVPQLRFFQAHGVPLYATSYIYTGKPEPAMDADLDGLVFGEMRWILDGVALYKQQKAEEKARKAAEEKAKAEAETITEVEIVTKADSALDDNEILDGHEEAPPPPDLSAEDNEQHHSPLEGESNPQADWMGGTSADRTTDAGLKYPYARTALDRLYALGVQSYQIIPRLQVLRQNSWMKLSGRAMTIRVDPNGNAVHLPVWARFESGLAEPLPAASQSRDFPDFPDFPNPEKRP